MASQLVFDALGALFNSLSPERKKLVKEITTNLTKLKIPKETSDAVLSVLILESSEQQFVEEGGAAPPVRESTLDILRPVFEAKRVKATGSN